MSLAKIVGNLNDYKMTLRGFHFKYYGLEAGDPYKSDSNASMWWDGEKLFHDIISREDGVAFIARLEQQYLDARSRNGVSGVHLDESLSIKGHILLFYLGLWHGKWFPYDPGDEKKNY